MRRVRVCPICFLERSFARRYKSESHRYRGQSGWMKRTLMVRFALRAYNRANFFMKI